MDLELFPIFMRVNGGAENRFASDRQTLNWAKTNIGMNRAVATLFSMEDPSAPLERVELWTEDVRYEFYRKVRVSGTIERKRKVEDFERPRRHW